MKLTIDKVVDTLYLDPSEGEIAETRQMAPGLMRDDDAKGRVLGIELLSLSKRDG